MQDETKFFFKSIIKAGIYDILSCKNRRGIFKVKFMNIKKNEKKNFIIERLIRNQYLMVHITRNFKYTTREVNRIIFLCNHEKILSY